MFKAFQKLLCTGKPFRHSKKQSTYSGYACEICNSHFSTKKLLDQHRQQRCKLLEFPNVLGDSTDNEERTARSSENQDSNFSERKAAEDDLKIINHHSEAVKANGIDIPTLELTKSAFLGGSAPSSIQIYFQDKTGKGTRVLIRESQLDEMVEKTKRLKYEHRCEVELKLISMYRKGKTRITFGVSEEWMESYEQYLNGTNEEVPGPIDNTNLKKKLRKKLVPQNTYAVNELLWKFLQKLYGGGPEITYTEDLDSIIFTDYDRSTGTTNDTFRKSVRSDDSRRTSLTDLPINLSPPNKPTSMPNPSLYCYMNSCLQALLSVCQFVEYIKQERYKPLIKCQKPKFWPSMAEVVQAWDKRQAYFTPKGIKLLSINHFNPNEQHDAHEFLNFMLTGLQEEINLDQPRTEVVHRDSRSAWDYYKKFHVSIIDQLFAGQIISKVKCLHCSNITVTYDPFLDLSLPIKEGFSLDECLTAFQAEEEILDSYKCLKCMSQQKAVKKLSIERFPKVLIIQLKRFQSQPTKAKRLDYIGFPIEEDWVVKPYQGAIETYNYTLRSVISHAGPIDFGHYTCFTKRAEDWFLCNDDDIKKVKPMDIFRRDAYVLIYEQKCVKRIVEMVSFFKKQGYLVPRRKINQFV